MIDMSKIFANNNITYIVALVTHLLFVS